MLSIRKPYAPQFATRGARDVARVSAGARVGVAGIADDLTDATSVDEVDRFFRKYLKAGKVPSWIKTNWWVSKTINANGHTLEILIAPDYAAVGSDSDFIRLGKTSEFFAQEYADAFDAILPSQKLIDFIDTHADIRIPYIPVQKKDGTADESTAAVVKANELADTAFDKYGAENDDGKLKGGYRKAYAVRPNLNGDYIAIYGGRWSLGGARVQPTSGHAHTTGKIAGTTNYSDTSHGIYLISKKAKLDGEWVDLRTDVFGSKDPSVYGLVSDEGRFDPVFPNAGADSIATFSVTSAAPKSGAVAPYAPGASAAGAGIGKTWLVVGAVALAMGITYLVVG